MPFVVAVVTMALSVADSIPSNIQTNINTFFKVLFLYCALRRRWSHAQKSPAFFFRSFWRHLGKRWKSALVEPRRFSKSASDRKSWNTDKITNKREEWREWIVRARKKKK